MLEIVADAESMGGREMSDLKPCPFCGSEAIVPAMPIGITDDDTPVECTNMDCNASDVTFDKEEWNTRPIEDALRKEIAQLKKDKLEFKAQCFHKDETISVLKNRITELKEIIDRIHDISMKKDPEFGLTYLYANVIIKQKAEIDVLKQENAKLRAEIAQPKAQEEHNDNTTA